MAHKWRHVYVTMSLRQLYLSMTSGIEGVKNPKLFETLFMGDPFKYIVNEPFKYVVTSFMDYMFLQVRRDVI